MTADTNTQTQQSFLFLQKTRGDEIQVEFKARAGVFIYDSRVLGHRSPLFQSTNVNKFGG